MTEKITKVAEESKTQVELFQKEMMEQHQNLDIERKTQIEESQKDLLAKTQGHNDELKVSMTSMLETITTKNDKVIGDIEKVNGDLTGMFDHLKEADVKNTLATLKGKSDDHHVEATKLVESVLEALTKSSEEMKEQSKKDAEGLSTSFKELVQTGNEGILKATEESRTALKEELAKESKDI